MYHKQACGCIRMESRVLWYLIARHPLVALVLVGLCRLRSLVSCGFDAKTGM